jgi:hypothetical protein
MRTRALAMAAPGHVTLCKLRQRTPRTAGCRGCADIRRRAKGGRPRGETWDVRSPVNQAQYSPRSSVNGNTPGGEYYHQQPTVDLRSTVPRVATISETVGAPPAFIYTYLRSARRYTEQGPGSADWHGV